MKKDNSKVFVLVHKQYGNEMVEFLSVLKFKVTDKCVSLIGLMNRYRVFPADKLLKLNNNKFERNLVTKNSSGDYIYDVSDNLSKKMVLDYYDTVKHRKVINEINKIDLTKMPLDELIAFKEKALMYKQKDDEIVTSIINDENITQYNIDKYVELAEKNMKLNLKIKKKLKKIKIK